jgi:hypothetical protein
MRIVLACLAFFVWSVPPAVSADEMRVREFIAAWVEERIGRADPGETELSIGFYDLDFDRVDEAFVLFSGRDWCGSGGCKLLVLRPGVEDYHIIMQSTVTRPPIGVLRSYTNGFRDIFVHIGGGGLPFAPVVMRFDGRTYPGNPTVDGQAMPDEVKGKLVIDAED